MSKANRGFLCPVPSLDEAYRSWRKPSEPTPRIAEEIDTHVSIALRKKVKNRWKNISVGK